MDVACTPTPVGVQQGFLFSTGQPVLLDIHIYSHIYIPPYNVPIKHLRRPSSGYQPMRDNFKLYKFPTEIKRYLHSFTFTFFTCISVFNLIFFVSTYRL